jgi:hypothetical protein
MEKQHDVKLEAFKHMMDGKTSPNHGHTHCVPPMCGGAMLTRNGQQFDMKLIIKIMPPNLQVTKTHE